MLLDNNWYVCVEESNYTREVRNIHAQKRFELLIPVFRQLDSGELNRSAIEHMLISVFYVNVLTYLLHGAESLLRS